MKSEIISVNKKSRVIIRKCHVCGELTESHSELQRCSSCQKSFLPLNYFGKVHAKNSDEYKHLFEEASNIHEDDLITGLIVLW